MIRILHFLLIGLFATSVAGAAERPPNVLFIAVDDLRPQLGCYGHANMHTPNIDRLASQGMLFERAYCMVPTCGASRASLMTGLRPTPNRFVSYLASAEKEAPGITTLNTQFKNHGYFTLSNGKIFHHPEDNAQGWSEQPWRPKARPKVIPPQQVYQLPENRAKQAANKRGRGPAYEAADVPDDAYADGVIASRSVQDLQRLARQDQPFFLAVGFFKPHLPFVAPQKYWDLYDREQIHLPETYHRPQDAPRQSIHSWGELRAYSDIPARGPLTDEQARTLIHGYYACVSYTDAQIGKLLDELDRLKLSENTIVVLWGDHGWNLGEHTLWCKHCCYETSMQVPLIVKVPGMPGKRKTKGLTELIDLYPTLCELAAIPLPDHLAGRSCVPLLKDPARKWKSAAIGRFVNGDTIRTDKYRFTEYSNRKRGVLANMLYDHEHDPQEDRNISGQPDRREIVETLSEQLNAQKGKDASAD